MKVEQLQVEKELAQMPVFLFSLQSEFGKYETDTE
jgi:hypothetical protein